jgi:hypothetical protein
MTRPVKLYNHSLAPNPRRVRIFAAEKGIINASGPDVPSEGYFAQQRGIGRNWP